jgi:Predicted nucleotide kinase (related to CMP and AMP kinases)
VKKLIIVNGTMGVGKTVTCEILRNSLESCVWLDGDWCWLMNPWNFCDENKRMVEDNIAHLLRNFLANSNFDYVIFSWVIHQESIFDMILSRLSGLEFEPVKITLMCSPEELRRRVMERDRDEKGAEHSIERLKLYNNMDTIKIDTTCITPEETVKKIIVIVKN